jgi:hypothetical protein
MVLDLNQLPYFDDYNENKNFHRVLFKPGVAVQARELTQLQTILQNQIDRFGSHIFENGSRVLGGKFDPQDPIDYVRVNVTSSVVRNSLINKELTGATTGLKANVIYAEADPTEVGVSVLFVRYSNTVLIGGETVRSFQNETLNYTDNNSTAQTLTTLSVNTSGTGSIFGISEGVLFVQGFFVRFDSQKIAMDHFSAKANKKIYFKATFSTVNSNEDVTLLDNAQGFNNFNAPGADRLKCELTLAVSDLDEDLTDDSTFLLIEVRNGEVYQKQERTQYSEIYEELARRTYDESGDYVVRGWDVFTREHLNTGTNGGVYAEDEGGDTNKIAIGLEKGLAYVKGYEINTLTTRYIETDKATESNFIDNQYTYVPSGQYIEIDEVMGLPNPDNYTLINLYDTAENRVTNHTTANTAASGTIIGKARVSGYLEESGEFGTADGSIRLYINNITMEDGYTFNDVRAVGTTNFFADAVLANGVPVLADTGVRNRLIYAGHDHIKSLRTNEGDPSVSFTFKRQSTSKAIANTGILTNAVDLYTANETLPYGTSTVGSLAKETIMLVVNEEATVSLAGTVSITSGNSTVTGTSTAFRNLNSGDRLDINGNLYIVDTVASDTSLTLTTNALTTFSGVYDKKYITGDIIDLNSKGATTGAVRTVTATGTSLSFNLNETFDGTATIDCSVSYNVVRQNVREISKNLVANTVVLIDGSTASDLSLIPLGFSDVYRIKQVRKSSSAFTSLTDGTDVTDDFLFNDGQTPTSYNTSFMIAKTPLANTEHLLVQFDHFEPDYSTGGLGYFSIDSYPIDDETESSTTIKTVELPSYNGVSLRNVIDTRPVREATANTSTTIAGATTNPAMSTTYIVPTNGLRLPVPGTNFIYDYSYYLARRDVLVVDKEGNFRVIKGQATDNPPFPKISDTYMTVASLYIPPYPSVAGRYAKILGNTAAGVSVDKTTFSRHTMRDIGKMKKRIKDVEYYTAINLLEKNTLDLLVPDENGLDRFKNGVFVDPFVDHSFSDVSNPDHKIAVDRLNKEIRPRYTLDGFDTNFESGVNIAPVARNTNLISIPFTETVLTERLQATTFRNVEFSAYRFIGVLNLYPDIDTWVDTTTVDKKVFIDTGVELPEDTVVSTEWGSWKTISSGAISGTSVTETSTHTSGGSGPTSGGKFTVYFRDGGEFNSGADYKDALQGLTLTDAEKAIVGKLNNVFDTDKTVRATPEQVALALKAFNNAFSQQELQSRYRGEFNTLAEAQQFVSNRPRGERRFFIVGGSGSQQAIITTTTTTTTTTTEQISEARTGIETTLTLKEELIDDFGSFVTDASLIPYIRPQTITLYAEGLKRGTQYFVFFDGERMNEYATPVVINRGDLSDLSGQGEEGDAIYSNAFGEVLVHLRLPNQVDKRFRVGEKPVKLTDSPTNDPESTSYAEATFVSSGLNLQKQNTILSTKTIARELNTVSETRTREVTSTSQTTDVTQQATTTATGAQYFQQYGPSCSAYSVYIDEPNYTEGVFMSSVDVWFQSLHPELGVWFEIREMSSDGNITRNTVPYSVVWMKRNDPRLNTSTDGNTNATNVKFESPVFLYNNTQYAFVIHTEGLNPDTYFWVSRLGEPDVVTGEVVNSRPLTGTFYTTNNNLNWDIVPDVDLKVRFNRADFDATIASPQVGTATFINEDVEFITANTSLPAGDLFFRNGEYVRGSEILTLSLTNTSVTIEAGDIIRGTTFAVEAGDTPYEVEATVVSVDGTNIYTDGFDFLESANVEVLDSANNSKTEATVATVDYGVAVIDTIKRDENSFDMIHSNGKFFVGSVMRSMMAGRYKTPAYAGTRMPLYERAGSTVPNMFAQDGTTRPALGLNPASGTTVPSYTIEAFNTYDYTAMDFRPGYLNFESGTNVSFKFRGATGTSIDTEIDMFPNQTREFNVVKNILSRSEEVRLLNGEKSFVFKPTLTTTNTYLSPMIDKTLMGGVFTYNLLNANTTGELNAVGGALESKYLSKIISLDDDNTAEDLIVQVAEYRPETTDVKVYARIKSKFDVEDIYQKPWFELTTSKTAVSSSLNKENYIDTTYQLPASLKTGTFNEVQYTLSGNPAVLPTSEMVDGEEYIIVTTGTTDFTDFGAANNDVNTIFTANNVAGATEAQLGNGTISFASDVVYTGYNQVQIKIGMIGTNRAVYPKASQLRAIALQV